MRPTRLADLASAPVRIAVTVLAVFAVLIAIVLVVRPDIMAGMFHAAMAAM